ncbi:hypothetical protein ABGV42_19135 [Paenibacillus pabuli]
MSSQELDGTAKGDLFVGNVTNIRTDQQPGGSLSYKAGGETLFTVL